MNKEDRTKIWKEGIKEDINACFLHLESAAVHVLMSGDKEMADAYRKAYAALTILETKAG